MTVFELLRATTGDRSHSGQVWARPAGGRTRNRLLNFTIQRSLVVFISALGDWLGWTLRLGGSIRLTATGMAQHIPGVGTVYLAVSDQDRALAFYRDKLGFEVRTGHRVRRGLPLDRGGSSRCVYGDRPRAADARG
jgi:hypothetical protein